MEDDEVMVLHAKHDTSSTGTHDASCAVCLEQRLRWTLVGTKQAVVRDGKGCSVGTVGEGARGEEEDVGVAGSTVEEVRCFEQATLVAVFGALEWVHVPDEGETVGCEFRQPQLRVLGVHLVPIGFVYEIALSTGRIFKRLWIECASGLTARDEWAIRNPPIRTFRVVIRISDADALLPVNGVLARDVHEIAFAALRCFDHLGRPQEARCACLVRWEWAGEAVVLMVRPGAEAFGVGALDVFAVAVGGKGVPGLSGAVVEDARIGKIVS